jgi:hypothetical protein
LCLKIKSCSGSAAAEQASSSAVEHRRRSCEILAAPDDEKKKNKKLSSIRNGNLEIDSRISDFEGGDTVRVLVEDEETKTMKELIDLEIRSGKNGGRDSRLSFWDAASVFSKRLRKWKRKRNDAACDGSVTGNGVGLRNMEVEKKG